MTAENQPPLRIAADGQLTPLEGELRPELGAETFPSDVASQAIRLDKTERLLMLSDGFTDPDVGLGLPAIQRAIGKADNNAAPATLRAIEDALREIHPDALDDDATLIVLAPSGMIGPAG